MRYFDSLLTCSLPLSINCYGLYLMHLENCDVPHIFTLKKNNCTVSFCVWTHFYNMMYSVIWWKWAEPSATVGTVCWQRCSVAHHGSGEVIRTSASVCLFLRVFARRIAPEPCPSASAFSLKSTDGLHVAPLHFIPQSHHHDTSNYSGSGLTDHSITPFHRWYFLRGHTKACWRDGSACV